MSTGQGVRLYGPGGIAGSDIVALLLHDVSVAVDALKAGAGQVTVVKAVATTAQALGGHPVIDGYQTIDGDVVLLTAQAGPVDNGLWTVFAGAWDRPADFKDGTVVNSRTVVASAGTVNAGTVWALQAGTPVTVGTTAQTWLNAPVAGLTAALAAKAADNAVVKLTTNQTVAGKKTLSTAPEVTQSGRVRVVRETLTPRQFGAPMNGIDPDTAGFRAALDAMGTIDSLRPAELVIDGPLLLDDTVIIQRKSGKITSPGWGSSLAPSPNHTAFIKWIGPAGIEMIRAYESWGLVLDDLRFIGDSAAKPLAAVRFLMAGGNSNSFCTLGRLWAGPLWGYDTDQAHQFETGYLWDGTNLNNDLMRLDTLIAHMCDTGFRFAGSQMGEHTMSHLIPTYCDVGIETATNLGIEGLHCLGIAVADIKITADARVEIAHFSSEGGTCMADLSNSPAKLTVRGGAFGAEKAKIRPDGWWINGQTPYVTEVTLEDFTLAQEAGYTTDPAGPVPVIRLRGGSQKLLVLDRCPGIQAANIDAQSDAGGERRIIRVIRSPREANPGIFQNDYDQGNYDETRHDIVEQTIAQRRATAPAVVESWRSSNAIAVNDEIGRWDFLSAAARNIAARMSAVVGPDFADSGELTFSTRYSGSAIAERLRILRTGALRIAKTTINPADNPVQASYLYHDKDDNVLKVRRPDGSLFSTALQAARADTAGATLAALEAEVNALKAKLRAAGLMAP